MSETLPRVTYSNYGADFGIVHELLDSTVPGFEARTLGQTHSTPFATGAVTNITSPIDGKVSLGRFPSSTAADVDKAVAAARDGARAWNTASLEERLAFADRWKAIVAARKYEMGLAALYEIGKSRMEAVGEAEECVDMIAYYASELSKNVDFRRPMNKLVANETAVSVLKPYGVFAVVAPFNFPIALSIGMIAGALLTGNAVVFKPSPGCALTGVMIAQTLMDAGLPDGVFNLVLGDGETGRLLTTHAGIDGVAFTGSHKTGMSIFRHMAVQPHMKPVIAEMGGKNPAYVTRNADLDRAAQGVARSAFGLQGQKCSACSVVYVDNSVKDVFIEKLVAFASGLVVGDPRQGQTFMGPVYGRPTHERFKASVAQARAVGKVHFGGESVAGAPTDHYVQPTVVELEGPDELTREELFMPFVVIRGVDSLEAGLKEGNSVNLGLAAGIFSQDQAEVDYFLARAEAGVLYANRASGATTGAWPGAQPFAGWKGTGVSGKGGLGSWFLPQFMREQSHTIMTV